MVKSSYTRDSQQCWWTIFLGRVWIALLTHISALLYSRTFMREWRFSRFSFWGWALWGCPIIMGRMGRSKGWTIKIPLKMGYHVKNRRNKYIKMYVSTNTLCVPSVAKDCKYRDYPFLRGHKCHTGATRQQRSKICFRLKKVSNYQILLSCCKMKHFFVINVLPCTRLSH